MGYAPPMDDPADWVIDVQAIKTRMAELGLVTSRSVARRAPAGHAISHQTVHMILSGAQPNPTMRTRRRLALALGMPADWLY